MGSSSYMLCFKTTRPKNFLNLIGGVYQNKQFPEICPQIGEAEDWGMIGCWGGSDRHLNLEFYGVGFHRWGV